MSLHFNENSPKSRRSISVSELNHQVRSLLESSFLSLRVSGEISNFARPSSGHWYFTLKDDKAQVRCAMFRNRAQSVNFRPKEGDQVVVTARVSLYEGRGDYQLICERMEEDGVGRLQLAFEQLKQKLATEGLFTQSRKRALPKHPRAVGVITSQTGAAIHDILTVFKRRYPSLPIFLYPTAVQGAEAAEQIVRAIELANRHAQAEVLIVGRGGGSLEDLWPFNEERVARAIAASEIPIVSAVGHEVDISISDLVADLRAPTPSAAAELLSPDQHELLLRLQQTEQALLQRWRWHQQRQQERLLAARNRLRHPGEKIREQIQKSDDLELRLKAAMRRLLSNSRERLSDRQRRLYSQRPERQIRQYRSQLEMLLRRLEKGTGVLLDKRRMSLARAAGQLNAISPLATLERGYALVTDPHGKVVRSSQQLRPGDRVAIRLQQGSAEAQITRTDDPDQHTQRG